MIAVIDTYPQISGLFDHGMFQSDRWENYINSIYANSAHIFWEDVKECVNSGLYTFEKNFLPVINAVFHNPKLDVLHENFSATTKDLDRRVVEKFGRELDVDLVLYLGLCNGAGWVTAFNGRDTVLLGVEKIIELDWCDQASMYGLIYHELGHVYHKQHGKLDQKSLDTAKNFVWQLFTEGIAMFFEQTLVGDLRYYHQDKNGWTAWCEAHFTQILADFDHDLPTMSQLNQRYFGDWCDYCGHGDTGYYLGCRFVQELRETYPFHELIRLEIDQVYRLYQAFVQRYAFIIP